MTVRGSLEYAASLEYARIFSRTHERSATNGSMTRAVGLLLLLVGCGGAEAPVPVVDAGAQGFREAGRDVELVLQPDDAGPDTGPTGPTIGCNGIEVTNVDPNPICNQTLTIEGKNFQPTPTVLIQCNNAQQNPITLTNVTFVSSTKLTASFPPKTNMWGGCDVMVVDPDACSSILPKAFSFWCEGPGM